MFLVKSIKIIKLLKLIHTLFSHNSDLDKMFYNAVIRLVFSILMVVASFYCGFKKYSSLRGSLETPWGRGDFLKQSMELN